MNDLLDPSVCSCFPSSSTSCHKMICSKIKWSTISITIALILIVSKSNFYVDISLFFFCIKIVYATSGLYTLIDVTTLMSIQSPAEKNGRIHLTILNNKYLHILFQKQSSGQYFRLQ